MNIVHVMSDGTVIKDITGIKVPKNNETYKVINEYIKRKNKKEEATWTGKKSSKDLTKEAMKQGGLRY